MKKGPDFFTHSVVTVGKEDGTDPPTAIEFLKPSRRTRLRNVKYILVGLICNKLHDIIKQSK